MEIFRQHGMAESVCKQAATVYHSGSVKWMTSLGGDGPFDRKVLAKIHCFGGGEGEQANAYQ